jgi:hypothetical protein
MGPTAARAWTGPMSSMASPSTVRNCCPNLASVLTGMMIQTHVECLIKCSHVWNQTVRCVLVFYANQSSTHPSCSQTPHRRALPCPTPPLCAARTGWAALLVP